jgi:hypothetical protein
MLSRWGFRISGIAGAGFELCDLRVMSPGSPIGQASSEWFSRNLKTWLGTKCSQRTTSVLHSADGRSRPQGMESQLSRSSVYSSVLQSFSWTS